jgi:glyoxylase-like metal-dependent hydrolase (beta-lactamase superfamily II)
MIPIRIELPTDFAVGTVNAYLFTDPEPILVDTGIKSDESWSALQSGLAGQGLAVTDLKKVIITHPHVDHFGQARKIASQSEASVWISELGVTWLEEFPAMWQRRIAYYRDAFMDFVGYPRETVQIILHYMEEVVAVCESVPAERVCTFGLTDTLQMGGDAWQVIHAPGHAAHQTCFYQPESKQFISADMLLARAPTPIVERPLTGSRRVPSLPRFMESLSLIESLDIEVVYPGHGPPFGDHRRLIQQQRERIVSRKQECLHLLADGYDTVAQLVDKMYAHLPVQFRFAGLWMAIGYLDLLKAEGEVEEEESNGVWHYRLLGQ